jgi:hypothetical protein
MWGSRAIRVGVLLGGVLALLVGAGCCHCWPCSKDEEPKAPPKFSNDQPSHLPAERVHGGIE